VPIDSSVRERVSRLLADHLDDEHPIDASDGAVAARSGTAVVYVRLIDREPPAARVCSRLLANACDVVRDVADYHDEPLRQRFGGELSVGDEP
jgi:type III secretion system-like peptide-binding chaperone